jgi:CRP-like cAMP-binding protein
MRMDRMPEQPSALLTRKLNLCGVTRPALVTDIQRQRVGPLTHTADQAPILLLSGWAAEICILDDGRRQIVDLLLPGQILSPQVIPGGVAALTVGATAAFRFAELSDEEAQRTFRDLIEVERRAREARLFASVVNLGRRSAYERLAHLLLDLHLRLLEVGLAQRDSFALPLTQEILSDVVGLSIVHVNRTLQSLRAEGRLTLHSSRAVFPNRAALADAVGYACDGEILPGVGADATRRRSA